MAISYGTIAIVPKGEWKAEKEYNVGNLVELDGSSYVAKVKPPIGTPPIDQNYWQVSATGSTKATTENLGVVKPDGVTTEVDENATLSAKKATQDTLGIVKGSRGLTIGDDGSVDVNTTYEQATELANLIAGEAISSVLGKVSKSIATTMDLDQNALLKNMLTNIQVNDTNKIPTAALAYAMQQKIEANAGAITQLNSDLSGRLKIQRTALTPPPVNISAGGLTSIPKGVPDNSNVINAIWYSGGSAGPIIYTSFSSEHLHFCNYSTKNYTPSPTDRIHIYYVT